MSLLLKERIGEHNINCQGIPMEIIDYRGCHDIDVKFIDGCIISHTDYRRFRNGNIISDYFPGYLRIGYLGSGEYKSRVNGEHTEEYIKWGSLLTRCYADKYIKRENYYDCFVCNEWHNFQNFAEWYSAQKYTIPKDSLDVDKDIKYKGNKMYSPATCILIPHRLNTVICNRANDRGKYPLGVTKYVDNGKYAASCNINKKRVYLGLYNTPAEAFMVYKKYKEAEIKRVADTYKDFLPEDVYMAIINYKIDITD